MKLVIVESPAKAKTINKYLGSDYKVLASFGHIRDLPSKDGSVDPDHDFAMKWELSPGGKKRLSANIAEKTPPEILRAQRRRRSKQGQEAQALAQRIGKQFFGGSGIHRPIQGRAHGVEGIIPPHGADKTFPHGHPPSRRARIPRVYFIDVPRVGIRCAAKAEEGERPAAKRPHERPVEGVFDGMVQVFPFPPRFFHHAVHIGMEHDVRGIMRDVPRGIGKHAAVPRALRPQDAEKEKGRAGVQGAAEIFFRTGRPA